MEYKLKLIDKDLDRIERLTTQMRHRCIEGDGECIYNLGVEDDGTISGITEVEYTETIKNITLMACKNNYSVNLLTSTHIKDSKHIYEILIREINENKYIDIKVAVAGNADCGKTSTIGSLVSGQNDNGRGLTRSYVFNYLHELKTGRTSSIAHQIIGFDKDGKIVNNHGINKLSWLSLYSCSIKYSFPILPFASRSSNTSLIFDNFSKINLS